MPLKPQYIIRIHIPLDVEGQDLADVADGTDGTDETVVRDWPAILGSPGTRAPGLQAIIDLISKTEGVGRLGVYDNCFELSPGEEWFIPGEGSHPTKGSLGKATAVKTIVLTTYAVGLSLAKIEAFLDRVVEAHPWEHPVIECLRPSNASVWLPRDVMPPN